MDLILRRAPLLVVTIFSALNTIPLSAQAPKASRDTSARTGDIKPPSLAATQLTGPPPAIDGRLDDEAWPAASVATDFVQFEPASGSPASETTEARVLYDSEALYVGLRLRDSKPDSIVARLARRDENVYSDWVFVEVDGDREGRTALVVGVNARGVKWDGIYYDDNQLDVSFDAVWDAAVERDTEGWSAEFRIPLSQLHFGATDEQGQAWGINFQRRIARREEIANWSPIRRNSGRHVSLFGQLTGLRSLEHPGRFEVQPYSAARMTQAEVASNDPFRKRQEVFGSFGADVKYAPAPRVTFSATINPDFGQVEADPSVVNLTAYQTFFPEKRPFFLEGADVFQFSLGQSRLFYSRRVGRFPQNTPGIEAGFSDVPQSTTVLGAGKFTARMSGGWTVGTLAALTSAETARFQDTLGVQWEVPAEPLTAYGVARVAKSFSRGRSSIGAIVTTMGRDLPGELNFLRSNALAGGVDMRLRLFGNRYEIRTLVAGSMLQGSENAIRRTQISAEHYFQRPDADHLTFDSTLTSLRGYAGQFSLTKLSGGSWLWGLNGIAYSPGFEVNDMGFHRGSDVIQQSAYIAYDRTARDGAFRRRRISINESSEWSFGPEKLGTTITVDGRLQTHSYAGMAGGVTREMRGLDPSASRGGPALVSPGKTHGWIALNSDSRRRLGAQIDGRMAVEDQTGALLWRARGGVSLRVLGFADMSLQMAVTRNINHWQHVGNRTVAGSPHYVFAKLAQTTADLTGRFNLSITPNISLQAYAQPFADARQYSRFKEVVEPRALAFSNRFRTFPASAVSYDPTDRIYALDIDGDGSEDASFRNPDLNFNQLRTNVVLRWEYLPGSTLFLVWNHERTDRELDQPLLLDRALLRLFGSSPDVPGPTNTFMVKLNYWVGF
jgi:hypothetical protein